MMRPPHPESATPSVVPAYLVAGLLVTVLWCYHAFLIGTGGIGHWDEFYTFERSMGFAQQNDWFTVYTNNRPSFSKPPLQYWMTAALLQTGVDEVVALRLPSMLFALGGLVAAGWLAAILSPSTPWAVPAAVLLCASSVAFWGYATSAMLDSGAALFLTLALATLIRAQHDPRWWYAVALVLFLGALQKAPIGFILVPPFLVYAIVARRSKAPAMRGSRLHARAAIGLAIGLSAAWPLLQSVLHADQNVIAAFYERQMINRFVPTPASLQEPVSIPALTHLILAAEPFLRLAAILALLVAAFATHKAEFVIILVVFAAFVLALWLSGGSVYERYSLIFVPILCGALSGTLFLLVKPQSLAMLSAAIVAAGALGLHYSTAALKLTPRPVVGQQIALAQSVGAELEADETLVVCTSIREHRLRPGIVSIYANRNDRPYLNLASLKSERRLRRHVQRGEVTRYIRGVCPAAALSELPDHMRDFKIQRHADPFVVWTAEIALDQVRPPS